MEEEVADADAAGGGAEDLKRRPSAVSSHEYAADEAAQSAAERVVQRADGAVERGQQSCWRGGGTVHGRSDGHQVDGQSL